MNEKVELSSTSYLNYGSGLVDVYSMPMAPRTVDVLVLLFIGVQALLGVRRGFVAGTFEVTAWAASLFLAILATEPLTELVHLVSATPQGITGLVILLSVFSAAFGLLNAVFASVFQRALAERLRDGALRIDRLLGVIPGAAIGTALAAIVLETALFLPLNATWSAAVMESSLGHVLAETAERAAEPVERLAIDAAQEASTLISGRDNGRPARFALPVTELSVDAAAERRMLELLNAERTRRGLAALAIDERLTAVARKHSEEMLREGYFAHESPATGTPFDRIARGGIRYRIAGENLVFAPNAERGHGGLMNSPEHRANILRPEFRRVGIGAMNGGLAGIMFTQNFTD